MEVNGSPTIIFRPNNDIDDYTLAVAPINEEFARIQEEDEQNLNDTTGSETIMTNRQNDGLNVGINVGLADRIIEHISETSSITTIELAEELGVTTRTIEREIKKLRETGRIERVGGKRYGHWEVLE